MSSPTCDDPTIDTVLARRAEIADHLLQQDQALARVGGLVTELAARCAPLGDSAEAMAARVAVEDARSQAEQDLAEARTRVQHLAARFSTGRLCVAAVGRARVGKSRFLQSLTGLTEAVIPTGNAGFCTGVTSIIRDASPTGATVHFLDRGEYLAVINAYLDELGADRVESLEQFWARPPMPPAAGATAESRFGHLKRHWDAQTQVAGLLGAAPVSAALRDVREWVTATAPDQGRYLAVDRVEITVPFGGSAQHVDVIDLPGLGDTNLTDILRFTSALRDTADALVLVRRPEALGDDWQDKDIQLATAAEQALGAVSLSRCLFLALNRTPDNIHNTERMLASAPRMGIRSAWSAIVDVTSPEEVREFYAQVAAMIPAAVMDGDAALERDSREVVAAALRAVQDVVLAASQLLGESTPIPVTRRQVLYQQAVDQLVVALSELLSAIADDRGYDEHGLAAAIQSLVISAEQESVSWVSEDDFRRQAVGKSGVAGAYSYYLNEVRARLLAHFGALDPTLHRHLELTKQRIADTLLDQGQLARVPGLGAGATLPDIRVALRDERLGLPVDSFIVGALDTVIGAQLAYRGFLQHRVREALAALDPNNPLYPLSEFEGRPGGLARVEPEAFVSAIRATVGHALGALDEVLSAASTDADWAAIALVDEFVHRCIGGPDAAAQWRAIYSRYQESIWQVEFAEAAESGQATAAASQALTNLRADLQELDTTASEEQS